MSAQPPEPSELLVPGPSPCSWKGPGGDHTRAQPWSSVYGVIACQERVHRQEKGAWTL